MPQTPGSWNSDPLNPDQPKPDPAAAGLPEWGKAPVKEPSKPAPKSAPRKKRRWIKVLAALVILLVLGVVILIIAAPTIASSIAPSIVETAAKDQIAGSVKVKSISVGWSGPMQIGPIELFDDQGKSVGTVQTTLAPGLWKIISEQWWSQKQLDIGQVDITGSLAVVRDADGKSTNLQRAIAPRAPKPATPKSNSKGSGGGPESIKGLIKLTGLDVTYTDKSPEAVGKPMATGIGVQRFGGDIKLNYDLKASAGSIKADLAGALKGAPQGQDKLTLSADVAIKQTASGDIDQADAKIELLGAPLDLVDGLVGFGGELAKSIGSRADVRINVNGNLDKATATVKTDAQGASTDLAFEYAGGVLKTSKPGVISVRSTDFLAGLPSTREKFKELGKNVRLDAGPGVTITLGQLSLPLPKSAIGLDKSPAAGAPKSFNDIDLRTAAIDLTVRIAEQRGQVALGQLTGDKAAPNAAPAPMKPFAVDPIELHVLSPQLAGPNRITASSKATIDGKPAGQLAVDLSVVGFLDANGKLSPSTIKRAEGEAKLLGVTTALLQPILDAANAKVDLAADVGPTIDIVLKPTTTGEAKGDQPPPTNVNLAITSANIKGGGDIRYDSGKVSTLGDGLTLNIGAAGPLVSRMMAPAGGQPAGPATISGKVPVRVTVKDVLLDTTKKPFAISDVRASVEARVSEASVALNLAAPEAGKPAPAPVAPINLTNAVVTASLEAGKPAAVSIDSSLSHENAPFTIKGAFTAAGLGAAAPAGAAQGQIEKLLALKLAGHLNVKDFPRSLSKLVPAADAALNATGTDASAEAKKLVATLLGRSVNLDLNLEQADSGESQRAKVDITGSGVSVTATARVSPKEINLDQFLATTRLAPDQTAALLSAATPKPQSKDGKPASPFVPMSLATPVAIQVATDPLRVPFKAGTTSPDLAAVTDAVVKVTTDQPVRVSNIPAGAKPEAAGIGALQVTAHIPVSGIAGEQKDPKALVRAKVTGDVLRPQTSTGAWPASSPGDTCAKIDVDAAYPINDKAAETTVLAKLIDVNAVALSPLTGDPLLLPGTLGDRIQLTANAKLQGDSKSGQRIAAQIDIDAPRLKGASIKGDTQGDVFRLQSAKMTWTPALDWLNQTVFKPKQGTPSGPTDQFTQEPTFTVDVKSLAVSIPKSDDKGVAIQGPLKPNVFALDLSLTSPGANIKRGDGTTVRADDIRVSVVSKPQPGAIGIDATIAKVTGADPAGGSKASGIHGTVERLADERGVLTPDTATINMTGDLDSFPTPLIDTLAKQNGKIVDLLGSVLNLKLNANNLSKAGGTVEAKADSPRAQAEIKGAIRDNVFVQDGKFDVNVFEMVKYEVAKKLPGGIPLVGSIEKKKGADRPATIHAEKLTIPIDTSKDMNKLNGTISVDPGTATFEFNDAFSKVLKELNQKDKGQAGRRLEPFVVNIKQGVATYDKFKLKFGEFTIETSGTADLVQKRIDVVTYVPAGAVTEEILGLFKSSLGGKSKAFDKDTKFPFTTKGPLENPKTEPDFGLFIKENAGKLLENVGGKAIEDLLKNLGKKDGK